MLEAAQWKLNDKIQYWKNRPDDEEMMEALFSKEERSILNTIRQFEEYDDLITQKLETDHKIGSIAEIFIRVEAETEISALLKEQFMCQIDVLLAKGMAEAWMEIMIWYSLLEEKKFIIEDYWEFPVLRTMIDIFIQELNAFLSEGQANTISILSLHNMQELTENYFRVIFLCRRIEYGVDSADEIMEYIGKKEFSPVFIRGIIQTAQIFNKEKVIRTIEEWCWN